MTQPLRSTRITRFLHYYGLLRPCVPHRYSASCGANHLKGSLGIGTTGSHVPAKSLKQRHALSTPDTTQPVNRLPLDLSQATEQDLVSMSSNFAFDASARVRLRSSHCSTRDVSYDAFSSTLTTLALNQSSLRSFKASPCQAALAGPPPSLHKLHTSVTSSFLRCLVAHAPLQRLRVNLFQKRCFRVVFPRDEFCCHFRIAETNLFFVQLRFLQGQGFVPDKTATPRKPPQLTFLHSVCFKLEFKSLAYEHGPYYSLVYDDCKQYSAR